MTAIIEVAKADDDQAAASANNVMKLCAGGRVMGIDGEVSGELTKFFKGAKAQGKGSIRDLGAIIDKLKPDTVGVDFYKAYTECVDKETSKELQKLNIPIIDQKLSEIKTQVSARKIEWPRSVFSADMVLYRIRIARSYDTVVSLFDASCPITVWLAAWIWPRDRLNEPVIKIKPTPSVEMAKSYPFQVKFARDGAAVDEAGWATRELPDFEFGDEEGRNRAAFYNYALGKPDEIEVLLAIRALGQDSTQCGGSIAIENIPRTYTSPH